MTVTLPRALEVCVWGYQEYPMSLHCPSTIYCTALNWNLTSVHFILHCTALLYYTTRLRGKECFWGTLPGSAGARGRIQRISRSHLLAVVPLHICLSFIHIVFHQLTPPFTSRNFISLSSTYLGSVPWIPGRMVGWIDFGVMYNHCF